MKIELLGKKIKPEEQRAGSGESGGRDSGWPGPGIGEVQARHGLKSL